MFMDKVIAVSTVAAFSVIAAPAFAQTFDSTPQSLVPTSEEDGRDFNPLTRNNTVTLRTVSPSAYLPILEPDNPALRQIGRSTTRGNGSAVPPRPVRPAPATTPVSIMTDG
jgi:hypothetical protein